MKQAASQQDSNTNNNSTKDNSDNSGSGSATDLPKQDLFPDIKHYRALAFQGKKLADMPVGIPELKYEFVGLFSFPFSITKEQKNDKLIYTAPEPDGRKFTVPAYVCDPKTGRWGALTEIRIPHSKYDRKIDNSGFRRLWGKLKSVGNFGLYTVSQVNRAATWLVLGGTKTGEKIGNELRNDSSKYLYSARAQWKNNPCDSYSTIYSPRNNIGMNRIKHEKTAIIQTGQGPIELPLSTIQQIEQLKQEKIEQIKQSNKKVTDLPEDLINDPAIQRARVHTISNSSPITTGKSSMRDIAQQLSASGITNINQNVQINSGNNSSAASAYVASINHPNNRRI